MLINFYIHLSNVTAVISYCLVPSVTRLLSDEPKDVDPFLFLDLYF